MVNGLGRGSIPKQRMYNFLFAILILVHNSQHMWWNIEKTIQRSTQSLYMTSMEPFPRRTKTLIIPYTCGKYRIVYVVGEHEFFHFDSLIDLGLHSDTKIRKSLLKLWAAWSGHNKDVDTWNGVSLSHEWIQASMFQHTSSQACRFYILKNIIEYTKIVRDSPHTLYEINWTQISSNTNINTKPTHINPKA